MLRTRVIPILLLRGGGLVKGARFRKHRYVGDPINAVRIFNENEVDELILLDISATAEGRGPNVALISEIASECFMPLCYGGGLRTVEEMRAVLSAGVEKVAVNTAAVEVPGLIRRAVDRFGSQSVVVAIDARRRLFGGYEARVRAGSRGTGRTPVEAACTAAAEGAGELLLTAVDREGTRTGYDLELIRSVSDSVNVPVIAAGGAAGLDDFAQAIGEGHASAVAAGSLFVFQGRHQAVLISYPETDILERVLHDLGGAG